MSAQAQRWSETERLFDEALLLPETERASFLARACGDDAQLHGEVSSLLRAAGESAEFLEPGQSTASDVPRARVRATLTSGSKVGAWSIENLIGRGGMSEVYLAQRADGQYSQRAALKLLNAELTQKSRHLLEERQILARLDHPGITRLIDGGVTADGRPFLVMEYVEGREVLDHCRAIAATLEQRLKIFLQICDAVAYAHRHLVVHRDLKPGNILVTAENQVRLLDFGIARLLDSAGAATANPTLHLTPGYAAPEQLTGQAVTTATDSYSLGVLLYELLSGQPPFEISRLPMTLALQRVLAETPPPASETARRRAAPPVPPAALAGDLDHIIAKALRKEPEHRYVSAAELKADIERYLRHEPVSARGYDLRYVLGRFVRRHRTAVGLASGAVLALLLGLSVSLWFYADARRARARAEAAAATTQAINEFLNRDLLAGIQLEKRPTRDVTLLELLDNAAEQTGRRFENQPEAAARVHKSIGESYFNLSKYEPSRAQYEKALALYTQVHGRDSGEALAVLARLASLSSMLGRYEQALALYEEAIAGYTRQGAGYDTVANLHVEASDMLTGQGDFQRAADQLHAVIEGPIGRGLTPADRLDAQGRYGAALFWLGDLAGSERYQRMALEGRIKLFGEVHMATAVSHLFVGGVLVERGQIAAGEKELINGLAQIRRWVGPDDAFLAVAECSLARLRMLQGRGAEAESLLLNALRIRIGIFGENSSFVAWTRQQLAEILQSQGRLLEARQLMQLALPVADATDGPGNPWTVKQRLVQVGILRELGHNTDAQAELAKISDGALSKLPATHPFLGLLRLEQGLVAAQARDAAAALARLTEALAIYEVCYGAKDERTLAVRRHLAALIA